MKLRIRTNARDGLIADNVPSEVADRLIGHIFETVQRDVYEVPFEWVGVKSTWNIRPELVEVLER
jgi:hypothetical protein